EVEERREPHDAPRRQIDGVEDPELRRLIDDCGRHGHRERERGQRPPQEGPVCIGGRAHGSVLRHDHYSAALRIASHSRNAWASPGEPSGWAGSAPTLGRISHERALFFPSASRTSTATPLTSSRRNASGGPWPCTSVAAEVIATSAQSTSTSAANRSGSDT